MQLIFGFLAFTLTLSTIAQNSFKAEQKKYPRVRDAYSSKESIILQILEKKSIDLESLRIYIRAFKEEKIIEVWVKNQLDDKYLLLIEYEVCQTSGELGPKRMQGDYQVPEGFYYVDRFNPNSNFHLSLGINYPNTSDRILGKKGDLGGDIFIHGNCVTIGCLPITDDKIKELYLLCVEAKSHGQNKIPVAIFPKKLITENFEFIKEEYSSDADKLGLWEDLKKAYDFFNDSKSLPSIQFLNNGRHKVTNNSN